MPILSAVSTCSLFMRVMNFANGVQFLNATFIFQSPFVAVISPVTRIYTSE